LADDKKAEEKLKAVLAGATLVVDTRIGELRAGLLHNASVLRPPSLDDGGPWISADPGDHREGASSSAAPAVRFRVRPTEGGRPPSVDPQWRERLRFAIELTEDGEPGRCLIVEQWRHDGPTEEGRSEGRPQWLDDHQQWVGDRARRLGDRLGLPEAYVDMLAAAALVHDEGTRSHHWQRAFNANYDGVYAKTSGPVNIALLDGYRHELGSLPNAEKDERLRGLPDDLRDVALPLMAAHHGFARPVIGINGCEDAPPSALDERAQTVALRFARLQKRWGPWGLAWWEALLRAADQQASRDNDVAEPAAGKEII
jgi:CRISPR-associated endonuclease/helicase Cas3